MPDPAMAAATPLHRPPRHAHAWTWAVVPSQALVALAWWRLGWQAGLPLLLASHALLLWGVLWPPEERAFAKVKAKFETLDNGGAVLEALPKDTPLAFLCHHGARSAQVAEHFRGLGFSEVYNIVGGIDAWADADPAIGKY